MNYFNAYIYLIFVVKIIFIILAIIHIYLKAKKKENTDFDKKIVFWKDRIDIIFVVLMSFLLIYLFNPRSTQSVIINGNPKFLLYVFGIFLLITANWNIIFTPAPWFSNLQIIMGNNR